MSQHVPLADQIPYGIIFVFPIGLAVTHHFAEPVVRIIGIGKHASAGKALFFQVLPFIIGKRGHISAHIRLKNRFPRVVIFTGADISGIVRMTYYPTLFVIFIVPFVPLRICHTGEPARVIIRIVPGIPSAVLFHNAPVAAVVLGRRDADAVGITGDHVSLVVICKIHLRSVRQCDGRRELALIITVTGDAADRILLFR